MTIDERIDKLVTASEHQHEMIDQLARIILDHEVKLTTPQERLEALERWKQRMRDAYPSSAM